VSERKDAHGLHDRGKSLAAHRRYGEAIACFDRALTLRPNLVEALHDRGIALRCLSRSVEALASHDRALALRPDDAEGHYNRGNALFELRRYDEALASYERALADRPAFIEALHSRAITLRNLHRCAEALASHDCALAIRPDDAIGLYNRGLALQQLGRAAEALSAYDHALALRPRFDEAHYQRGTALFALRRHEEALSAFDQVLLRHPGCAPAHLNRATVLRVLRRPQEAVTAYRRALECGADREEIEYFLAGLGAAPLPATAPRRVVTALFDQCADEFEMHLAGLLKYRAPDLIAVQIARFVKARDLDVLDLGCGTGLVGARLRALARSLTGVDLSAKMLEQARRRNIYDRLVRADLIEFLRAEAMRFDLVVAGDVFIYVGDLAEAFRGVRGALTAGGHFGFSVETSDAGDFFLGSALRYAHSTRYLRRLADANGFALVDIERAIIRQEEGVDVDGDVVLMRAPD
jgi:predicted TPR repeat methyltransferase/regulator of sirC expression with transglutaminase-like and TPR domain